MSQTQQGYFLALKLHYFAWRGYPVNFAANGSMMSYNKLNGRVIK